MTKSKTLEAKIEEFEEKYDNWFSMFYSKKERKDALKSFFRTALSSTWDIAEKVGREEENERILDLLADIPEDILDDLEQTINWLEKGIIRLKSEK